jgi:N-acetylmuramoyl-L-alanine amidase
LILKVEKLIIHHSLTKDQTVADWPAIRRYYINEMNMVEVGYNWGVEGVNGAVVIQKGRPETISGAYTKQNGMNKRSLGICVVGNYDLAEPSEAVLNRLADLCAVKCREYHLRPEDIEPHHKYAPYKTCPGTRFPMDELRRKVENLLAGGRL